MQIEIGDFIIINVNDNEGIAKILRIKNETVTVVLSGKHQADKNLTEQFTFKININDILVNLGPNPVSGKYNKLKLDVWRKALYVRPWGNVHLYRDITEAEETAIVKALKWQANILKEYNLDHKLPLDIEIRPKDGKYAGKYKFTGDKEEDAIILHPMELVDLGYVIAHECGHYVNYRFLSEIQKKTWIDLYHSSVKVSEISLEDIRYIRKELVKSRDLTAFKKDQEDKKPFNTIIKYIRQIHKILDKELNTILKEGNDLKEYWPNKPIDVSDTELQISDYGTKNYHEYFSEVWAFYHTEKQMPKLLKKAMRDLLAEFVSEELEEVKPRKKAA